MRHAARGDEASLARLRHALWPDGSEAEHRQEVERFITDLGHRGAVLVAEGESGLLGFAEVSIRAYAEGCRTDRVGLFSGDHLMGTEDGRGLEAGREVCWYSWPEQIRSMERLLELRFECVLPGHGGRYRAPTPAAMRGDLEALVSEMRRM